MRSTVVQRFFIGFSILLISLMMFGCCNQGKTQYTWEKSINGKERKAEIIKSNNSCGKRSAIVYFHGRGGAASTSVNALGLHDLWPEAVVAYAEGTNFDNNPSNALGWEIRFPHMALSCDTTNDLDYVEELIKHLIENENVDQDRIYASGHSSGGFFTLSLAQLMRTKFRAFAAMGAYSSYSPVTFNCSDSYEDGIQVSAATNLLIGQAPAPTFYSFGFQENTIKDNSIAYDPDCAKFSYAQNTILQLSVKNNSQLPNCAEENFMTSVALQIFPPNDESGSETQVRFYNGPHSIPSGGPQWIVDFFKSEE